MTNSSPRFSWFVVLVAIVAALEILGAVAEGAELDVDGWRPSRPASSTAYRQTARSAITGVESANFVITGTSPAFADQVAQTAERARRDLALYWLGRELPGDWFSPARIRIKAGPRIGARGATTFIFDGGEVFGWEGTWQGTAPRILDAVIPHEVTHAILASHFRRPVPRWADEGAACLLEAKSERATWIQAIRQRISSGPIISLRRLFSFDEYPADFVGFYAESSSVVEFLVGQKGPRQFVEFLGDYFRSGSWDQALRDRYGFQSVEDLERAWISQERINAQVCRVPLLSRLCGQRWQVAPSCRAPGQCGPQWGQPQTCNPTAPSAPPIIPGYSTQPSTPLVPIRPIQPERPKPDPRSVDVNLDDLIEAIVARLPKPQRGEKGEKGDCGPPGECKIDVIVEAVLAKLGDLSGADDLTVQRLRRDLEILEKEVEGLDKRLDQIELRVGQVDGLAKRALDAAEIAAKRADLAKQTADQADRELGDLARRVQNLEGLDFESLLNSAVTSGRIRFRLTFDRAGNVVSVVPIK